LIKRRRRREGQSLLKSKQLPTMEDKEIFVLKGHIVQVDRVSLSDSLLKRKKPAEEKSLLAAHLSKQKQPSNGGLYPLEGTQVTIVSGKPEMVGQAFPTSHIEEKTTEPEASFKIGENNCGLLQNVQNGQEVVFTVDLINAPHQEEVCTEVII
jgi:hypothetical protein